MVLVLASSTNKEFDPVFATREVILVFPDKDILVLLVGVLVLNVDGSLWYTCNCALRAQNTTIIEI
jgi:hypothetical protein